MPNQRAANQTLIAFALDKELLKALDLARNKTGEDRSTFVRQALFNALKIRREPVRVEWVKAQVRAHGEHRYVSAPPAPAKPASPAASAASTLAKKAVASVERSAPKPKSMAAVSGKKNVPAARSGKR